MRRTPLALLVATALLSLVPASPAPAKKTTVPKPSKAKPVPIDVGDVEKTITSMARGEGARLKVTVGKATCPKGVKADRPSFSFQCTIPYEGLQAPYVVTLDTATMRFDIQPGQAILVTSLLTSFVKQNLSGDPALIAKAKVDCGKGKVQLRPPGATVECLVSSPKGGTIVVIKVIDVTGRVEITGNKPVR